MSQAKEPRLLVSIVDQLARDTPEKIYASIPKISSDGSLTYEEITYGRWANAINRAAWWLEETLGKPKERFQTLAYFGPADTRYWTLALAGVKTGYKFFFSNPRNDVHKAQPFLFQATNCSTILYGSTMHDLVDTLVKAASDRNMQSQLVPEQDIFLDPTPVQHYSYTRTFEEGRRDPLIALHTSGTTGLPKPIHIPQGYARCVDLFSQFPDIDGRPMTYRRGYTPDMRVLTPLPCFHVAGLMDMVLRPILCGVVTVMVPPDMPVHAELIHTCIRKSGANAAGLAPTLIQTMISVPEYRETLLSLKRISHGAGLLDAKNGKILHEGVEIVFNVYGQTETECLPTISLEDPVNDWQYFHFHPWTGTHMEPMGYEGVHELVIRRVDDHGFTALQPCFEVFPDVEVHHTKDLFVQHPSKNYLWKFVGRNDDVIALSNGEMFNPVDAEGSISAQCDEVADALMCGQGRFNPALMLDLKNTAPKTQQERETFLSRIWPAVEEANSTLPSFAQIPRELIIFTGPEKPFSRTPKGSVQRRITIDLFKDEIEDLFLRFEREGGGADGQPTEDSTSEEAIQTFLKHTLCEQMRKQQPPALGDDLFRAGMDSLVVLRLVRAVNSAYKNTGRHIDSRLVYANPTLAGLISAVFKTVNGSKDATNVDGVTEPASERAARIEKVIDQYTQGMPSRTPATPKLSSTVSNNLASTVLLTGSTGTLGTYLLSILLANPSVNHIFCLNRSEDAATRQATLLASCGLPTADLPTRVTFIQCTNPGAEQLSLDLATYTKLSESVTHIITNAWPVDFNLSLQSFADVHVAGVRRMVDFSVGSTHTAKIAFVSSVASVARYAAQQNTEATNGTHGSYGPPEVIIEDPLVSEFGGYGESKYVAERILAAASKASAGNTETTIFRVGQIAGPIEYGTEGVWNTKEWFPRLIRSSATIRAVPDSLGPIGEIDWLPIDIVAEALVDLTLRDGSTPRESGETRVYHLLNPAVVAWERDVLPTVLKCLPANTEAVPLSQWTQNMTGAGVSEDNPALQLSGFFEKLAAAPASATAAPKIDTRMQTRKTIATWPKLEELGPVKPEWVRMWMKGWGFDGQKGQ